MGVRCLCFSLMALLAMMLQPPAAANHVVEMPLPQLADYAGQVIEGEVASIRSYWTDEPRRMESEITFVDVQFHKGALDAVHESFTLRVPGGQIGDVQMRLCCAPQFGVGQRWILMLLPTYKTYPVVGLYQGAFEIRSDERGGEAVYQAGCSAVTSLDADGFVQCEVPVSMHRGAADRLSAQPTAVVRDVPRPTDMQPMSVNAFRAQLREICSASAVHELTFPAGQPAIPQRRAVPLRSVETTGPAKDARHLRAAYGIDRASRRSSPQEKLRTNPESGSSTTKEVRP